MLDVKNHGCRSQLGAEQLVSRIAERLGRGYCIMVRISYYGGLTEITGDRCAPKILVVLWVQGQGVTLVAMPILPASHPHHSQGSMCIGLDVFYLKKRQL